MAPPASTSKDPNYSTPPQSATVPNFPPNLHGSASSGSSRPSASPRRAAGTPTISIPQNSPLNPAARPSLTTSITGSSEREARWHQQQQPREADVQPSYLAELNKDRVLSREPSLPSLMSVPRASRPGSPDGPVAGPSSPVGAGGHGHARRTSNPQASALGVSLSRPTNNASPTSSSPNTLPLPLPSDRSPVSHPNVRALKASTASASSSSNSLAGSLRGRPTTQASVPPPTHSPAAPASSLRAFEEGVGHYERVRSPSLRGHSRRGSWSGTELLSDSLASLGALGGKPSTGSPLPEIIDEVPSPPATGLSSSNRGSGGRTGRSGVPLSRTQSPLASPYALPRMERGLSNTSAASGRSAAWSLKEWVEERGRSRIGQVPPRNLSGGDWGQGGELDTDRYEREELDWNDVDVLDGVEAMDYAGAGDETIRDERRDLDPYLQDDDARVFEVGDKLGVGTLHQDHEVRDFFDGMRRPGAEGGGEDDPLQGGTGLLEIVRQVGVGSYAVVYLVREVLYDPALDPDASPEFDPTTADFSISPADSSSVLSRTPRAGPGLAALTARNQQARDRLMPHASLNGTRGEIVYGRDFALKCLCKRDLSEELLALQRGEAELHRALPRHDNIVALHRALETPNWLFLVIEYCPGQDLFYWLEQARDSEDLDALASRTNSVHPQFAPPSRPLGGPAPRPPSLEQHTPPSPSLLASTADDEMLSRRRLRLISRMFGQMCDAVEACHSVGVCHRDIKPENFIVVDDRKGRAWELGSTVVTVKITDWGLGTSLSACEDFDCGSKPYMAYECRNNLNPSYDPVQADVWSLGIVLLNLLYHRCPWADPILTDEDFSEYRSSPINFLLDRFEGMTRRVAGYLAQHVFCEVSDSVHRVSAGAFGEWSKDLIRHLEGGQAQASASDATIPLSPSSARGSSVRGSPARNSGTSPASDSRPPSGQNPPIHNVLQDGATVASPTPTNGDATPLVPELSPGASEEDRKEGDEVTDGVVSESGTSERHRRRKRGQRKGRRGERPGHRSGAETAPVSPTLGPEADDSDYLREIGEGVQSFARDVSKSRSLSGPSVTEPPEPTVDAGAGKGGKHKFSLADRFRDRFGGANPDLQALIANKAARDLQSGDTVSAPAKLQRLHHVTGSNVSQFSSTASSSGVQSAVSSLSFGTGGTGTGTGTTGGTSSWGSYSSTKDEDSPVSRGRPSATGSSAFASTAARRERLSAHRGGSSGSDVLAPVSSRKSGSSSSYVSTGTSSSDLGHVTSISSVSSGQSAATSSRSKLRHGQSSTSSRLESISEGKHGSHYGGPYASKDASTSTTSLENTVVLIKASTADPSRRPATGSSQTSGKSGDSTPTASMMLPSPPPPHYPPVPSSSASDDASSTHTATPTRAGGKTKLASLLTTFRRFNQGVHSGGGDA